MVTAFLVFALLVSSIAPLQHSFTAKAAIGDYSTKHISGKGDSLYWSGGATNADGTKVLINGSGVYYYSEDSGASWTEKSFPFTNMAVSASEDFTKLVAAHADGTLYTSNDSGETWTTFESGNQGYWRSIFYTKDGSKAFASKALDSGEYLVFTKDADQEWQQAAATDLPVGGGLQDMTSNSDGSRLVIIGQSTIYVSTDFGETWTTHAKPELSNAMSIASSGDGRTLLASMPYGGGAVYLSTNYGETWTVAHSNDPWTIYSWTVLRLSHDGQHIVVGTHSDNSVYVSDDNGATWTMRPSFTGVANGSVQEAIISSNGSVLYAGEAGGSFYRSTDLGATWTALTITGARSWRSIQASTNGRTIVATQLYSGDAYISRNYGQTWDTLTGLPENANVTYLKMSSNGRTFVVPSSNSGNFYISHDTGATWTAHNPFDYGSAPQIFTLSADGQHIVVDSAPQQRISTDGGATWTLIEDTPFVGWNSMTTNADGSLQIGASSQGLFISRNGGTTWETVDAPAPADNARWYSVSVSADGTRIIATQSGGYAEGGYVYLSDDSGVTWQQVEALEIGDWNATTMSSDGRKISIAEGDQYTENENGGQIFTSVDYGQTWEVQSTGAPKTWKSLASTANGNRVFAAGDGTPLYSFEFDQPTIKLNPNANSSEEVTLGDVDTENRRTITNRLPVFSGKTFPNGAVTVTVNSDPIVCETTADAQGNWSCELPSEIPVGNHTIRAAMVNPSNATTEPVGPFLVAVADNTQPGAGNGEGATGENGALPGTPNTGVQKLATAATDKPMLLAIAIVGILTGLSLMTLAMIQKRREQ